MTENYAGTELELFAAASNWKAYVASALIPFVRGRVLDVGAGIGGNMRAMANPAVEEWVALEPDVRLAGAIDTLPDVRCTVVHGTLDALPGAERFDSILYMDVLEHIENDRSEVERAARFLNPGGCLIVLVPAHQFLFSPFDSAIGHYRRYNRRQLSQLKPAQARTELSRLMDSVGFFASLANRMFLRQSVPTSGQIAVWDRLMVRASRIVDPITRYRIGKSVLMVWRVGIADGI